VAVVGLFPPPLLPVLGVRVFTGGASSGLCDGFGFVGDVAADESDELPCRPDDVLPSDRFDEDFPSPEDFFDEPPNSRLKKPGLLSSLLDMSRATNSLPLPVT